MTNLHPSPLLSWWPKGQLPFLIAGPCSVETREQLLTSAQLIAQTGAASYLRGGIWKPRTRPDSFEGVGEVGLDWMVEAKSLAGLPIITEVANAHHVELCLKKGFDALWIGARTTVNPFTVQEIADALQGVNIPIVVKNPVNPDLQLWIGALERFDRAGVHQLIALHRGFSYSGHSIYRNKPMWEIPIALMAQCPSLPVFCDPSHICGRRDLLQDVAQKALDLGMSGLMLESHPEPDSAWSDAKQQITPQRLLELVSDLNLRQPDSDSLLFTNQLALLRAQIDKIDEEILQLISHRMQITSEIGLYKKEHKITILQLDRWKEIQHTRSEMAKALGITPTFLQAFLDAMHAESIRTQTKVMNESKKIT
jgi:chorismate mutase